MKETDKITSDFFDETVETGDKLIDPDEPTAPKKKSGFDFKKYKWGFIGAGATVILTLGGTLVGYVAGTGAEQTGPTEVQSIQTVNSTLDNLESLKDSQIQVLNNQLKQVTGSNNLDGSTNSAATNVQPPQTSVNDDNKMKTLLKQSVENRDVIDSFLDQVMSVKPTATDKELNVVQSELKDLMTTSAGATGAYDAITGPSAAKQLGEAGRKAAASNVYIVNIDKEKTTYMVVTPFATEKKLVNQVALITIDQQKVSDYSYVGLLESDKPGELQQATKDMIEKAKTDNK